MKTSLFITLLCLSGLNTLYAKDTVSVTLTKVLALSEYSVEAIAAKNEYRTGHWEHRYYRGELLPEVTFTGSLPYYSRSSNEYQNVDGSFGFVNNHYNQVYGSISVDQNIPLTGGKLSLETSLQRIDQFGDNSFKRYMAVPAKLTYEQPILGFNRIKWLQKIEPVKYKEAKARYLSSIEEVRLTAVRHFFNLLMAKVSLDMAQQNYQTSGMLYGYAKGKHDVGQVSDVDLLQLRVSLLNAETSVTDAQKEFNSAMNQLCSFLGYDDTAILLPEVPDTGLKEIQLNYPEVLALSIENNPFTHNIQRRVLEASRDLIKTKAERNNISLFASVGWSGYDSGFRDAYSSLRNNQLVSVGVKIPLLDWGKSKSKVKIAESNLELVNATVKKEQLDFNQNIRLQVENFNMQFRRLAISQEADTTALSRYNTSIEAFVLGKMDVLNLLDAQISKDEARRNYIEQTFLLWAYYYQIRSLTLYDFTTNEKLEVSYSELIDN